MHRAHAPAAASPTVELSPSEAHHVTRVLRLGVGDELVVFDGAGREWLGRLASVTRHAVLVDLVEERTPIAEPLVAITVGIGLLKGDQMDAAVRDATMMGASAIAPFVSAHVALGERARQARSLERWMRVAVASAKQSGRAVVPAIRPLTRFENLVAQRGTDLAVLCVEPRHQVGAREACPPRPHGALLLIGPEGGWAQDELAIGYGAGAHFLNLGPRTLRAEATPAVALSVLWTQWGWK